MVINVYLTNEDLVFLRNGIRLLLALCCLLCGVALWALWQIVCLYILN